MSIPALRNLLGSIRPTDMLSGQCKGVAAMGLMNHLMKRNATGDLKEAVSVAKTYQKVAGRAMLEMYFGLIARLLAISSRPREAARLAGFADGVRAAKGVQLFLALEALEEIWALIRTQLPEDELTALRAEGAKMSADDALRLATEGIALAEGKRAEAASA